MDEHKKRTKRISRQSLVTGALGTSFTTALLRFPAGAAEFSYKWGLASKPTHPAAVAARETGEKILHDSGGRLEIKLYPYNMLGSESSMLLQIRQGALEFQTVGDADMAQLVPVAGISAIPFAFGGYKEAWTALDGGLGAYIVNEIRKAGFTAFPTVWDAGLRQVANNVRPVTKPDDLKGLKMRVPPAPVSVATFKALGATATAVTANEIYTSLQTHLVDGVELPLISINDHKFYETLKYMSIWNYQLTVTHTVANIDAFQRLPKNIQDIVAKDLHDGAVAERNEIMRVDGTLADKLKTAGMTFNQVDVTSFKARVRSAGLYTQWRDQYGGQAWALLERSVGKLA
jgi:TRAP-type transport system periplasmic protein